MIKILDLDIFQNWRYSGQRCIVFQFSEKWKGLAWLLMINLLSFEMSDCFMSTDVFFFILQVSYGVLCVAMTHQLLFKSAALQVYSFFFFLFQAIYLISSGFNTEWAPTGEKLATSLSTETSQLSCFLSFLNCPWISLFNTSGKSSSHLASQYENLSLVFWIHCSLWVVHKD